jgi:hypothetical protein
MGEILNLPRLSNESPLAEPQAGGWAELALSVARVGVLPIRTDADLQEAIMVLRLANARTKELTRLAEHGGRKEQVSAGTAQVDDILDELRARPRAGS